MPWTAELTTDFLRDLTWDDVTYIQDSLEEGARVLVTTAIATYVVSDHELEGRGYLLFEELDEEATVKLWYVDSSTYEEDFVLTG